MKILADASLANLETFFPKPFELSFYAHQDEIPELLEDKEILLCRSTLKLRAGLLKNHFLKHVATASSGRDHLDLAYLASENIKVSDANGSNARAVVDYVLSCLVFLEKYKDLKFKTIGIIGMGAVGSLLAEVLKNLDYSIKVCDPFKIPEHAKNFAEVFKSILESDVICIHTNLHDSQNFPTRNLISKQELALIKPDTVIINAARGGIVDEKALLENSKPLYYCTDVFSNEPEISADIVDFATICTPHIAGHTVEAKLRALRMLSIKLHREYSLVVPDFDFLLDLSAQPTEDYNPFPETIALKEASCKKTAFLSLRKAHQTRHDSVIKQASLLPA